MYALLPQLTGCQQLTTATSSTAAAAAAAGAALGEGLWILLAFEPNIPQICFASDWICGIQQCCGIPGT
jgi:hypothetical protein